MNKMEAQCPKYENCITIAKMAEVLYEDHINVYCRNNNHIKCPGFNSNHKNKDEINTHIYEAYGLLGKK